MIDSGVTYEVESRACAVDSQFRGDSNERRVLFKLSIIGNADMLRGSNCLTHI